MKRATFFFTVLVLCTTIGLFLIPYHSANPVYARNRLTIIQRQAARSLFAQFNMPQSASSTTKYSWGIGFVLFDFNNADPRPDAQEELLRIINIIKRYPGKNVEITGFTASEGDADYSKLLSLHRAQAVKQWLQEQDDLREIKFVCIGFGDFNRDPNETAERRQRRRRANISILMEITVMQTEGKLVVKGASDVMFDFDSYNIRPDALQVLRKIALVIMNCNTIGSGTLKEVLIEGHTDSAGEEEYNQKLSLYRAEAVKQWLQEIEYLRETKFQITGWGENKPITSNDTAAGRQKNRRVEITILQ